MLPRIPCALSFTQLPDCIIKPDIRGLLFLTSKRQQKAKVKLTSFFFFVCVFSVFCFPGILTMSTPWMTGARPSVGCKCRSYNSWSCRYCLSVCFGPNIYVSSSPDTSPVSAEPLPVRLIAAMGSLVEGEQQNEIIFCTFASNQSLKMCYVCMTARKRYMKGPGLSREDNYILNFTGF